MQTKTTAAQRRAILANAHAKYFASRSSTTDIAALQKALVDANLIALTDSVINTTWDGTLLLVTIDIEFDVIEIDAYGNTLRGTV